MNRQEVFAHSSYENFYGKIRRPFQSLLFFVKTYPLISFGYLLIFAIGVFFRLFVWWNYGSIQWDEGAHSVGGVFISKLFLNGLRDPAGFIGRYLTNYPATLVGLWFYPPSYGLLASLGYLLLGFNDLVTRLPSLIFSVLLIHATIRVSKEIEPNENVALVSSFLVATSSTFVIVGSGAMLDIPQTTLIMYSILFWIKGTKNHDNKAFLKAGVLGGLAGLMKPTGIFILLFMIMFQTLMFLVSKDDTIFSRRFWKGIVYGLLIFSTWWISALVLKFTVGGWIGEAAFNGVTYWFNFFGIFGKYIPPWYSPQWYTYQGWTYYAENLSLMMGILPFLFSFVGVCYRINRMKRHEFLVILFILSTYILQTFTSNKNPRYIIMCLPIIYIFSSIGIIGTYENVMKLSPKLVKMNIVKKLTAISLIVIFALAGLMPLYSALKVGYTPGMWFGTSMPIRESLQIIKDDGNEGIIIPDLEDNYFNAFTLTFYIASMDNDGKYGCCSPPSNPEEIFSIKLGDKGVRYVLVHDLNSNVSRFIHSNPESFVLIGNIENPYGSIFIYKVIEK